MTHQRMTDTLLISTQLSYLLITMKPRLAANEMKSHLARPNILCPEERDFKFAEIRNNRSLLEDNQNLDFSKMMAKNEGFFFFYLALHLNY